MWAALIGAAVSAISNYNQAAANNNANAQNTMFALANAQRNAGNPNLTQNTQQPTTPAQSQPSEAETFEQARMA